MGDIDLPEHVRPQDEIFLGDGVGGYWLRRFDFVAGGDYLVLYTESMDSWMLDQLAIFRSFLRGEA